MAFAESLKTEVDLDKDGKISKDEFTRGYCKWVMLWAQAKTSHELREEAAAVYAQ